MRSRLTLLLTVATFFSWVVVQAQCDADKDAALCIKMENEGYHMVKSFKLDGESNPGTIEVSSVFAKNIDYSINTCESGQVSDQIVVTIYDSKRKKIASNNEDGNISPTLNFTCKNTGVYYVTYEHEKSRAYCGLSAVSFKRDESRN
ncbi:MAG: hypothetical protein ACR2MT_18455 [Aurantibacter sp.]